MGSVFVGLTVTLAILQKDECPLFPAVTPTALPSQQSEGKHRPRRSKAPRYRDGLGSWSIPDAFRGFANWLAGVASRGEAHACVGEWQIPDIDSAAGRPPDCRSLRQFGPAYRIR